MRNINNNAVQCYLSKNYLTRKNIALNILDTKYSRFTVSWINFTITKFHSRKLMPEYEYQDTHGSYIKAEV